MGVVVTTRRPKHLGPMKDSPTGPERPLYLYIALLGNLIAVAGMAFLLLGVLGALGLNTAVTNSLGGLGSSFASATTGSAIEYSFAFLAALISLAASWKMFREGPSIWLLAIVVVFQAAAASVFHSWVSVIALIPTVAALYGLVLRLVFETATPAEAPASATPVRRNAAPPAPSPMGPVAADGGSGEPTPPRAEAAAPPPPTPGPVGPTPVEPPAAGMRPTEPAPATDDLATRAAVRADARPAPPATGAPAAATSRRCADCGSPNGPDARFCNSCGSILPG
jgi:hypothetical protein